MASFKYAMLLHDRRHRLPSDLDDAQFQCSSEAMLANFSMRGRMWPTGLRPGRSGGSGARGTRH